jgi:DHA3 family macrolide efflux protein-like MFS transporter
MDNSTKRPAGMFAFIVIWLGQIVSILASGMSQFALSLWMYDQTKSATAMGLMQVFFITPFLIMSVPAGVMVDRYNRKLMMMVSDFAAILATGMVLTLFALGRLEFWHLYIAAVLNGLGNTFQWPAYSAAISTMVPKEQLGRANGLMSLMEAGPGVLAPILAGALYPFIGLTGLLGIDVATFFIAIGALAFVHIPQPQRTQEGAQASGGLLKEAWSGFQYIFSRPSLLGLQMVFFFGNLFSGMTFTLLAPMVLARTGQDSLIFGSVQTIGAVGGILGGIIMSVWSGLKRRQFGVIFGWMMEGVFFVILLGVGRGLPVWGVAMVLGGLIGALINTSNQAFWQAKVAPDLQGRVFSARRLIAWFTQPIAPIIAGTLADYVLEPSMQIESTLSATFSRLVGTGPGAGMSLLMVFCGIAVTLIGLTAYFIPAIREADKLLPDHDVLSKVEPEPA